ncbi:MAG: CapA family protein [Alistipes sp.]|nr:CapA family protein [Alistipes sp.]
MRGGWLYGVMVLLAACVESEQPLPQQPVPTPVEPHTITLLFGGDVMVHTPQLSAAKTADGYDFSHSFAALKPLFEEADLTVLNLETTLAFRPPYQGYPLFRSPAELAHAMRDAGVDVVALANNHALDMGASGVRSTLAALDSVGLRHLGLYRSKHDFRPLIVERDSIRLVLLNYTYGTNGMPLPDGMAVGRLDTTRMKADLRAASHLRPDAVVALVHWGIEYERTPNREQRRMARWLHDRGVDIIIGSHPHVVQPYEADSTRVCFYSLGNLVSNQRRRYTDGGLLARIRITKHPDGRLSYESEALPVWVNKADRYQILPLSVADTLSLGTAYRTFRQDTEQHLQKGV